MAAQRPAPPAKTKAPPTLEKNPEKRKLVSPQSMTQIEQAVK